MPQKIKSTFLEEKFNGEVPKGLAERKNGIFHPWG